MKKILISLMAIALVIGLVGAGAFAYFSDVETSTGNSFTAGTLDLKVDTNPTGEVNWADGPLPTLNSVTELNDLINNMKPGDTISGNFGIKNAGTIDGTADFKLTVTANDDNGLTDPESTDGDATGGAGEGELGANINVVLTYGGAAIYSGTLNGMSGTNCVAAANLLAGQTASWEYTVSIAPGVGNIIQSDSVAFNIEFSLNQVQP